MHISETQIPTSDFVVYFAGSISVALWWILFVVANYFSLRVLFMIDKSRWAMFLRDYYYHAVWIFVIPMGYWGLIEYYEYSNNFVNNLLNIAKSPFAITNELSDKLMQAKTIVMNSPKLTIGALIGAIILVYTWSLVHRKASKLHLDYWWTTGSKFTAPGIFFLFMCVMVFWSIIIFLVNVVCDETILYVIIYSSKLKNEIFTEGHGLDSLSFITNYLNAVLLLCAIGYAVGFVLEYDRRINRKSGKYRQNNNLIILNTSAIAIIFIVVFVLPHLFIHDLLSDVRQELSLRNIDTSQVPVSAVASSSIIIAFSTFTGIIGGFILLIESFIKK